MRLEYVGILLNDSIFRGIPAGRTQQEHLEFYEEAAHSCGLIPCYFRLKDISLPERTVSAYIKSSSGFVLKTLPLPTVIHNRAIHQDQHSLQAIDGLLAAGIIVYNAQTRWGKDYIHRLLEQDPMISPYLPHTVLADSISVQSMLNLHGDIVIKPCSGSVGLGIMRLYRNRSGDFMTYSRASRSMGGWRTIRITAHRSPGLLRSRIRKSPFLVQQRIPLAAFQGKPFDIRVTVQRGFGGEWGVTGMYAKTSAPGTFVSNLAQGAAAYPVEDPIRHAFPGIPPDQMLEHIAESALLIAHSLSRHIPCAADFGLDIGIAEDGRLFFIECNGRDQRYGFRKAGLPDMWRETYRKPVAFARYLADCGAWPVL